MKAEVESIIRGAIAMDPSVTAERVELAMRVLRGESLPAANDPSETVDAERIPNVISYKDAQRILGIRKTQLFAMIKVKRLRRVYAAGTHRGVGISRKSFLKVIDGRIERGRNS